MFDVYIVLWSNLLQNTHFYQPHACAAFKVLVSEPKERHPRMYWFVEDCDTSVVTGTPCGTYLGTPELSGNNCFILQLNKNLQTGKRTGQRHGMLTVRSETTAHLSVLGGVQSHRLGVLWRLPAKNVAFYFFVFVGVRMLLFFSTH